MSGGSKRRPKHQNKAAFKIKFDQLALDQQKKVSFALLCKRCIQQLQWKCQYNKYKKITEPGKCNFCAQKVVARSYMKACDPCAKEQDVCPKCLENDALMSEEVKLSSMQAKKKQQKEEKEMNDYVNTLRVRSKKKVARELQKGVIFWDSEKNYFIDKQDNQITGLHFKTKNLDDIFDEDQEDIEDDICDEEQKQEIKKEQVEEVEEVEQVEQAEEVEEVEAEEVEQMEAVNN